MSKASEEAQKQLDRIVALGYPDVADMSAAAFRSLARPLIRALEDCDGSADLGTQILLVPTRELVTPESLIARTSINRMAGFTTMPPRDIASFLPQTVPRVAPQTAVRAAMWGFPPLWNRRKNHPKSVLVRHQAAPERRPTDCRSSCRTSTPERSSNRIAYRTWLLPCFSFFSEIDYRKPAR